MDTLMTILFFSIFLFLLVHFARHEHIQDFYISTIDDVEGKIQWARSRNKFPYGMKSQMQLSQTLLSEAKALWENNRWQKAYKAALKAQSAMDKAQEIYCKAI